jgi:hypothetical protein
VPFLTGTTVTELEEQAAELAEVIGAHQAREQQEPADLLTAAKAAKAQRKQALLTALTGRREQPRDELGRFARGGFDGGARAPLPARGDPEAEHAQLAADLIARSRQSRGPADVGRHF